LPDALPTPPAQITAPGQTLTRQQKAAVIVRLLQAEGAELSLLDLSGNHQTDLVHQMADLTHVDDNTLKSVVKEFLGEFSGSGLSFPGSLENSLTLMEDRVSEETTREIRSRAGLSLHADPWAKIRDVDVEELLPLFGHETIEVGAVILSKLKVATAADLLGRMPGERARRITYALSLTGDLAPNIVRTIGQSIAEQLDTQTEREFDDGPVERVGAILNFSPAATRDDVLEGLQQVDAGFADQVRRAIFTFANIPERLNPRDVPKITRDIDPATLITALVGAKSSDPTVVEFILENMSQRMADQIREEMEELGEVKQKDGEAAMTTLIIGVRALADAGEIVLVMPED